VKVAPKSIFIVYFGATLRLLFKINKHVLPKPTRNRIGKQVKINCHFL